MLLARVAVLLALAGPAPAETFRSFKGHGGPVMSVAVSADGTQLLTASFDNAAGVWPVPGGAPLWLDGHEAAVNAGLFLPGERAATAGDDFAVLVWDLSSGEPLRQLTGHRGKVAGLAAPADGARLATASWDGTVRVWETATGALLAELALHSGPVNDVVWSPDGERFWTAAADGTVTEWDAGNYDPIRQVASHGFGVNVLALNETAGWLAYGGLDGGTRVIDLGSGGELADLTGDRRPILALALSPDGRRLAVGDGEGHIMVVATDGWRVEHDFRAALHGPIWALAFTAEGDALIAGGIADEAYLWPLDETGVTPRLAETQRSFHVDPESVSNGERQFLRKCSVCHELGAEGARRAGPPLGGLFGRRAGAIASYAYSDAVATSGITWTEETIDRLFDQGPEHYIPGTKMPMQRIARAQDRADLIEFLKRETALEVTR